MSQGVYNISHEISPIGIPIRIPNSGMKLTTDLNIRNARLPAGTDEKYVAVIGHKHLCLRIRPHKKDWFFRYRPEGGNVRKLWLGTYPGVTLSEATEKAATARKLLNDGVDPQEHRLEQRTAEKVRKAIAGALPQTVSDLFELWIRQELIRRKDQGAEVRRSFDKDVLPAIGSLPLGAVRRANVTAILDAAASRGSVRIAGMLLADLRQMFAFAVAREIMVANPTTGLKKAQWNGQSKERERVLSEAEIKKLAQQLPPAFHQAHVHAIWIMLSTCCRVGEISKARWEHVDLKGRQWTIPQENAKNDKPHLINLSDLALEHFKALRADAEAKAKKIEVPVSEWVMPAKRQGGHVSEKSLAKLVADRQRGADGKPMKNRSHKVSALVLSGGRWTPHDLRRTGATMMGRLGVRPDVIEKCLNHVQTNRLVRVYQRQELRAEMKAAWTLLGDRLTILSSTVATNVSILNSRAA
jgi:integrase